jgi:hypothetical protein
MHARLSGARQAPTCCQRGPSVAVREKGRRCAPTVPTARMPVPGLGPHSAVGRVLGDAAPGGLEDPPVRGHAVPLDVGAQQPDEVGRDRDGAGLVGGTVLQAAFLPRSAVIGPAPPGTGGGGGGGRDDPPPPLRRQVKGRTRGASPPPTGATRRSTGRRRTPQVSAPVRQAPDGGQEFPRLGRADHDPAVDGLGDGGGGPLDAVDGIGGEVAAFDGVAEGVVEHRPLAPLG